MTHSSCPLGQSVRSLACLLALGVLPAAADVAVEHRAEPALHRRAEVRAHIAQLLGAEHHHHHHQHDQPVPNAQSTHRGLLKSE